MFAGVSADLVPSMPRDCSALAFRLHQLRHALSSLFYLSWSQAHAEWLLQAPAESPAHELIQELHKLMQKDWGMLEEQFYQLECSLKFLAHLQME